MKLIHAHFGECDLHIPLFICFTTVVPLFRLVSFRDHILLVLLGFHAYVLPISLGGNTNEQSDDTPDVCYWPCPG
jgi:hypothetical protein